MKSFPSVHVRAPQTNIVLISLKFNNIGIAAPRKNLNLIRSPMLFPVCISLFNRFFDHFCDKLPFSDFGTSIQSAQMNVNGVHESVFVTESAQADLDPTVDTFCRAITDLQNDGIDDSRQVVCNGIRGLFDGAKLAAHGPTHPVVPTLEHPSSIHVMP